MKPHSIEIPVDVLRRGVLLFIGSEKQLFDYLTQHHPDYAKELADSKEKDEEWPGGEAITFGLSGDAIIYSDKVYSIPTLVHELAHATKRLLEITGIKNEEMFCYTLEYLFTISEPWLTSLRKKPLRKNQ